MFSTYSTCSVFQGVIDIGTDDSIQIVSGRYLKNERTGNYSALCIDYKQLSSEAIPSAGLVSIMISQVDSKEHIIRILQEMMRRGVSCKEMSVAFGIIHSFPVPVIEKQESSVSSLEYGDGSILKSQKGAPSVLSLTMKFVESIYGFSENKSNQKVFVLTQEDMFSLVFCCLSECEVILIL